MDRSGSHQPTMPSEGREAARWRELRTLLTGPEQRQLAQILKRLDDPVRRAEELATALPDALSMGAAKDGRIARALQPTLDAALKASVRKNPKALADAIFPALGPAIRKAISTTLLAMVQSLNHLLNRSLSFQGLKWRLEAVRTQRPFAEVVLLHTLVYRVEQIFLIHRHTGIVLEHAGTGQNGQRDPDLVSGMLTAIQDFVKDSFDADSGEILDTLRMDGDHSVWIEQGSQVILAVVIRGIPPLDLRDHFRELLDKVHLLYADVLHDFDGRVSSFAMIKPDLEDALTVKLSSEKSKTSPLLWVLAAAVIVIAGFVSLQVFTHHRQWRSMVSALEAERGIVITSAERRGGRYYLSGLKDPLARDPGEIVDASGIDPQKVHAHWQPYRALDDAMVLRRAQARLKPPHSVELRLSRGVLSAHGRAPHAWVRRFQRLAATVAGVNAVDASQLTNEQMVLLQSTIADLENRSIHFAVGRSQLRQDQEASLRDLLKPVHRIQNLSRAMQLPVQINIIGYTDASGRRELNLQLSQQRAQFVLSYLISNGADPVLFDAIGAGSKHTPKTAGSPRSRNIQRHVTFRIDIIPEWVTYE
jgi:outer membrane protein OmpA-like peptidoglycan-associated protein